MIRNILDRQLVDNGFMYQKISHMLNKLENIFNSAEYYTPRSKDSFVAFGSELIMCVRVCCVSFIVCDAFYWHYFVPISMLCEASTMFLMQTSITMSIAHWPVCNISLEITY